MLQSDLLPLAPFVRKFARDIVEAASGKPILDVGCGSGRNAIPFLQQGCTVICLDRDFSCFKLDALKTGKQMLGRLIKQKLDLIADAWPFAADSIGGIINVHLTMPILFPKFAVSLSTGGYLLLETVPAHGGNYLELPKRKELKPRLASKFDFEIYNERKAGPRGCNAVTVQLLARRK